MTHGPAITKRFRPPISTSLTRKVFLSILVAILLAIESTAGLAVLQAGPVPQKAPSSSEQRPPAVTLETTLIQLDVFVTDKSGRPVTDLRREDFAVFENGAPQVVTHFSVESFDASYEPPATAEGQAAPRAIGAAGSDRTVLVLVDDNHLTAQNLVPVKRMLHDFVLYELRDDDQFILMTSTGSLGFLQQLTDDRAVMRMAVDRVSARSVPSGITGDRPALSPSEAESILRRDPQLMAAAVAEVLAENPSLSPQQAEAQVLSTARRIIDQVEQEALVSINTLASAIRSLQRRQGMKVVIFISEGFLLSVDSGQARNRLRSVIDAATRSSVVVYTIDCRGLEPDTPSANDSSRDMTQQMATLRLGNRASERLDTQGTLVTIAHETGGTAFKNSNDLKAGMQAVLAKNNFFYSLGYLPANTKKDKDEFRAIEVRIKGRSDLQVRFQKGYSVTKEQKPDKKKELNPRDQLQQALFSVTPYSELSLRARANFVNLPPSGSMIVTTMLIDSQSVSFQEVNGRQHSVLDLVGLYYNASGDVVHSFSRTLNLNLRPDTYAAIRRQGIQYVNQFPTGPGLYQVRLAVREQATGRLASLSQWVEVPDLAKSQLALSDIFFVGELPKVNSPAAQPDGPAANGDTKLVVPAARTFRESDWLDFGFFVYNASRLPSGPPDVVVQIQLVRNNAPVFTSPLQLISPERNPDPERIFYGSRVSLKGLAPGKYYLQIIVIDRALRQRAFERLDFTMT